MISYFDDGDYSIKYGSLVMEFDIPNRRIRSDTLQPKYLGDYLILVHKCLLL